MDTAILEILLIEDNPGDARLIEEMLNETNLKFKLEYASSLSAGIKLIGSNVFNVILLDLGLPDSQGLDTLSRLNKSGHIAPVIVLTGLSDDAAGIEAVKKGAQDYLIKGQINSILLGRSIKYAVERKKVEQRLQESEEKFRALIENARDGIFLLSSLGEIVTLNASFARMHGYTVEEMIRMELKNLDTPQSAQLAPGRLQRLLAGESMSFEVEHYCKNGLTIPLEVSANLIIIGDKKYILGFHRDINERKKVEEELRKHREHLEELVKERTAELNKKNEELEKFNKLFVGRELRMIELKKKISDLEKSSGKGE